MIYPKRCQNIGIIWSKYHFDTIKIGERRIYPWTNEYKCYNYKDSNIIRWCVTCYIKNNGGQFHVRRHLAGMEVTRLE